MTEPLKDIPAAAEWLDIPVDTLRKMVSARQVPHTRIGKHVRFAQEHLDAIVAAGEQRPRSAGAGILRLAKDPKPPPPSTPRTPPPPPAPRTPPPPRSPKQNPTGSERVA